MRDKPKMLDKAELENIRNCFHVAGISFCRVEGLLRNIDMRGLRSNVEIKFEGERHNEFDQNAVRVDLCMKGFGTKKIGYIPRTLNYVASWVLDEGRDAYYIELLDWNIVGGVKGKENYGVAIEYRFRRKAVNG